jgi:hypothetical protein
MTMEIAAIAPTTPPAIAPPFEVLPFGGPGVGGMDGVGDGVTVELEDALTRDVDTPAAPKIAPGPYSGLSI